MAKHGTLAGVIFLGGLAGQQRPRKGHVVADADGAHVQGERVERVHCLIGSVAVRGDGIEHDEGWRPGHSARPDDAARSPLRHAATRAGGRSRACVANDRLRHVRIGYARVSKADGSQSLDLRRDALQVEGVAAKSTVVMGEVSSPTHE